MTTHEYHELMTTLKQIRPEDARRELHSTDAEIAARLSEFMDEQIAARR